MTSITPEPEATTTVAVTGFGTSPTRILTPSPAPSGDATVSATTGEITLTTPRDHDKAVLIHPGVRVQVELPGKSGPWDPWTSPESSDSSVLQRLSVVSQPAGATIATFVGVQAGQAVITAFARVRRHGSGPHSRAPNIGFRVTVTVLSG
jgi:hypothetical protein